MSTADQLLALSKLYHRQLGIYGQMVAIGQRNRELAEKDNAAELLVSLNEYSQLMAAVDEINGDVQQLQESLIGQLGLSEFSVTQLQTAARKLPALASQIGELVKVFGQLRTVLEQLLELTESGAAQVRVKAQTAKHSVQKVRKGKHVTKAYGQKPYVPGSHFLDKKR